jgi:predicted nucleotidyltransferase
MVVGRLTLPADELVTFCQQHGIRRLAIFGSALRDDFRPDSDVDVLVEYLPGTVVGLLRMADMEIALSRILGRRVDLRTPAELSRYFRDDVLASAVEAYAAR